MNTIRLDEKAVKAIFETAENQSDALIALYRMVFPEWDRITKIDGWPTCNKQTWTSICRLFMNLDERKHADVMPGGMWMNNGFSGHEGEHLKDWQVERCPVVMEPETPGPSNVVQPQAIAA